MRDVNRIDKFLEEFGELWKKYPDLRFSQIVCNLQRYIGNDGFYLEEEDYIQKLKDFLTPLN